MRHKTKKVNTKATLRELKRKTMIFFRMYTFLDFSVLFTCYLCCISVVTCMPLRANLYLKVSES